MTNPRSPRHASGGAAEPMTLARHRLEPSARRIRVHHDGEPVADSTSAVLAFVEGEHPDYLVPVDDVDWTALAVEPTTGGSKLGLAKRVLAASGEAIGRVHVDGPAADLVQFDFAAMSAWFEESEQIFAHPRDPYRRVDVLESDRRVVVRIDGREVARTTRPRLVVETGLPPRWYVPRSDVDWSVMVESDTTSACQYKGHAEWWHVLVGGACIADVAWAWFGV